MKTAIFDKPTELAVGGKMFSIAKIGEKSFAQFRQQIKRGIPDISDAHLIALYNSLGGKDAPVSL